MTAASKAACTCVTRHRAAESATLMRRSGCTSWEEKLSYAPPAYKTPIVMRPQALPWLPAHEQGVFVKQIGVFPHRGLTLTAWRLEPHATHSFAGTQTLRLLFVMEGGGTMGLEALQRWSVVRLEPAESAALHSATGSEVLELSIQPVNPCPPK